MTQTKAERLAMIHQVALKLKAKKARKEKMEAIRDRTRKMKKELLAAPVHSLPVVPQDDNSEIHWSDAPKYAEKYYGSTFNETTRYDNDWGDY